MTSLTILRRSSFVFLISMIGLFDTLAQTSSEDLLKLNKPEQSQLDRKNILTALLKTCARSEDLNTQSCINLTKFDKKAKSLAEVYLVVLNGDKSFKEAGFNKFKEKQDREKMKSQTDEIKKTLASMDDTFISVRQIEYSANEYDFDNETIQLRPGITTKGLVNQRISIIPTDGKSSDYMEAKMKLPMSKAEKLFDNQRGRFEALRVITYNNVHDVAYEGTLATVKSIKVYLKETGELLWEQSY